MSCLDVMYHQSYGAHYLPAATYYNHHQQQQQRKLSVYSKMQGCMEQQQQGGRRRMLTRDQGPQQASGSELNHRSTSDADMKDGTQPAETEYLSSRCVLFTYFQGDIGDVVDEHFTRALKQTGTFNSETRLLRVTQSSASETASLWKDGGSLSEGQSSSVWSSTYPSHTGSCLPSVSAPVHPDFSHSPVSFNHPDGALWAGHVLSQASLPPPTTLPDSWTYSLSPQGMSGYHNVHDIYHPHPHIHSRHHHPVLHSCPTHSPSLDSRFNPLLLPGVRNQGQPAASTGSSPNSEGVRTEMDPSSNSPVTWTPSALHGSLEVYDSGRYCKAGQL
uniref:Vestigial-like family member 3 n=1 Tax=Monopterus albus TaxID=43700 RepID=A0A3Q3IKL0_MONAL